MGDWEQAKPVLDELSSHLGVVVDVRLLVLDDFAKTGDCVVSCMVVLGYLHLLGFNLWRHSIVDG